MAVWEPDLKHWEPPLWLLTGHMLLWNDGSPAHIDMAPFKPAGDEWEAQLMISRSTLQGTRWLTLTMRLSPAVRKRWEQEGRSARARALQELAIYLKLTEWYGDDLGLLELN